MVYNCGKQCLETSWLITNVLDTAGTHHSGSAIQPSSLLLARFVNIIPSINYHRLSALLFHIKMTFLALFQISFLLFSNESLDKLLIDHIFPTGRRSHNTPICVNNFR